MKYVRKEKDTLKNVVMSKLLRLDFVRDEMKIPVCDGDRLIQADGRQFSINSPIHAANWVVDDGNDSRRHVKSFAPRKNEGMQPVGGDIVVDFEVDTGLSFASGRREASLVPWNIVTAYTPNYDALLKMQNEFDKKESEVITEKEMKIVKLINDCKSNLLIGRYERAVGYLIYNGAVGSHNDFGHKSYNDICTVAEFNQGIEEMAANSWVNGGHWDYLQHKKDCELNGIDTSNKRLQKEAQPIYTKAMQDAGKMPSVGMKVAVAGYEYKSPVETKHTAEVLGIYEKGEIICQSLSEARGVELFSKWWPIETRTPEEIEAEELEVARKEQREGVAESLKNMFGNELSTGADFMGEAATLQDEGHLAEIILPLKG